MVQKHPQWLPRTIFILTDGLLERYRCESEVHEAGREKSDQKDGEGTDGDNGAHSPVYDDQLPALVFMEIHHNDDPQVKINGNDGRNHGHYGDQDVTLSDGR